MDSHLPLTIDSSGSSNNYITIDYTYPKNSTVSGIITNRLTIMIPDGTYTSGADLASAINSAIDMDASLKGKITADYGSNGLTFMSVQRGKGCSFSNLTTTSNIEKYKKTNTAAGGTAVPGENKLKFPAYIRNSKFSTLFGGDGVEINDLNDTVSISQWNGL